jgi:hypothetical protein
MTVEPEQSRFSKCINNLPQDAGTVTLDYRDVRVGRESPPRTFGIDRAQLNREDSVEAPT